MFASGVSVPAASAPGAVAPIAMPVVPVRVFRATTAADNTNRPLAWLLLKFFGYNLHTCKDHLTL